MSCANPDGPFVVTDGVRTSTIGMADVVDPNAAPAPVLNLEADDEDDMGAGAGVGGSTIGMGSTIA